LLHGRGSIIASDFCRGGKTPIVFALRGPRGRPDGDVLTTLSSDSSSAKDSNFAVKVWTSCDRSERAACHELTRMRPPCLGVLAPESRSGLADADRHSRGRGERGTLCTMASSGRSSSESLYSSSNSFVVFLRDGCHELLFGEGVKIGEFSALNRGVLDVVDRGEPGK